MAFLRSLIEKRLLFESHTFPLLGEGRNKNPNFGRNFSCLVDKK